MKIFTSSRLFVLGALFSIGCGGLLPSREEAFVCDDGAVSYANYIKWCQLGGSNAAPSPATDLAVSQITDSSLLLNWKPGVGQTGFSVEIDPGTGTFTPVNATPLDGTANMLSIDGLGAMTTYRLQVVSINVSGRSVSSPVQATTSQSLPDISVGSQVATPRYIEKAKDGQAYLCLPPANTSLAYATLLANKSTPLQQHSILSTCMKAPATDQVLIVGSSFSASTVPVNGYSAYDGSGAATESFPGDVSVDKVTLVTNPSTKLVVALGGKGSFAVMTWRVLDGNLSLTVPALPKNGGSTNDGTAKVR